MHIKHITLMAGPGGTYPAGTEREVAETEGRALVAGGYAIEIHPRRPEHADRRAPETATAAEQTAAQHLDALKIAGKRASKPKNIPATAAASADVSTDPIAE